MKSFITVDEAAKKWGISKKEFMDIPHFFLLIKLSTKRS
ncbi:MAG: hypothetical protein PWQ37_2846 [Candidatus Petromonas sp.]|jgi:hypothetical protein|nr:hypothetical protein [Candidatus Petromonas sp.]